MPGPDGFTVAGRIRAEGDAPIVVVSGESSEEAKVRALGIGADDYLVKPFGRAELLARIGAVIRRADRVVGARGVRGAGSRPVAMVSGNLTMDPGRHEGRVADDVLNLTPIEYRLLELLVRAQGDVVAHLQLVRGGWPAEADPDLLWLKPHIARLRSKLEAASGPKLVPVRGVGYRLEA
jgi:two-component system, OmpR family, KDP operon response regulator KdpE